MPPFGFICDMTVIVYILYLYAQYRYVLIVTKFISNKTLVSEIDQLKPDKELELKITVVAFSFFNYLCVCAY